MKSSQSEIVARSCGAVYPCHCTLSSSEVKIQLPIKTRVTLQINMFPKLSPLDGLILFPEDFVKAA